MLPSSHSKTTGCITYHHLERNQAHSACGVVELTDGEELLQPADLREHYGM
jgi:hypothetical protein